MRAKDIDAGARVPELAARDPFVFYFPEVAKNSLFTNEQQ